MVRTLVTALLVSVVLSTPTWAQDQTRLIGMVTDAQSAILPGVTVTAQSPALIGTQTAVTETDGRFRFPSLPPGRSDPLGINFFQNVNPAVPNRQESTNWQARLLGRYVFPYELGVSANLRAQSGWQYSRLLRVALPNAGTQTFFAEDIDNNRSDEVVIVDLRADKAFTFGGRYRVTLMADLFNALNSNAVSNFNLLNGSQFNRIIATLDPRTLMLGARFGF